MAKSAAYLGVVSLAGLLLFFLCANKSITRQLRNRLVLLQVYCIVIAFLSPTVLVFNCAAGLIVPMFANRRQMIAPVYLFAMITLPIVSTPLAVGGLYLLSMNAVVAVTVGAALTALVRGGGGPPVRWSLTGLCVFFIFAAYVWPGARSTSLPNFARLMVENGVAMLIPYYIIRRSVRTLDDIRLMSAGLLAVASALSVLAMYEAWHTWPLYRVIYDHYGVGLGSDSSVKVRGGMLRASGPFPEPLSLAFELALCALLGFASRWMCRSRQHHYALMLLLFMGLLAPQSRGALLGLGVGIVAYQIMRGKIGSTLKALVGVGLFGGVAYAAGRVVPFIGNFIGLNAQGVVGKDYRQSLLDRGFQEAQKHIWFGNDISNVMYNLRDLYQGEGIIDFVNTYLYVLLVGGVVVLVPFVAAILWPVQMLAARRRYFASTGMEQLAFAGAALTSIAMMLTVTSLLGKSTITLCVMLALAGALVRMPMARGVANPKAPLDDEPAPSREPAIA